MKGCDVGNRKVRETEHGLSVQPLRPPSLVSSFPKLQLQEAEKALARGRKSFSRRRWQRQQVDSLSQLRWPECRCQVVEAAGLLPGSGSLGFSLGPRVSRFRFLSVSGEAMAVAATLFHNKFSWVLRHPFGVPLWHQRRAHGGDVPYGAFV